MTWSSDGIPFTVRKTIQVTVTDNFIHSITSFKTNGVVCSPIAKCMFLSEYSALLPLMFGTYPASKCMHYPKYVHACLCWFGSHCFTQDSARLPERRRRWTICVGDDFGFTTLELNISRAKGIWSSKIRLTLKFRRDSEDLQPAPPGESPSCKLRLSNKRFRRL